MKKSLLLSFILSQSLFALVSIMPVEIGSKAGFHGTTEIVLDTFKGNTDKENYKGVLKLIYDNNVSYVTWAEVSAEYGESQNIENTNKMYLHLRYIYALTKENVRGELFTQAQEDKFKLINYRRLAGVGLRFKLPKLSQNSFGYFGIGSFYEAIKYLDNQENEKNLRVSTYLAYSLNLENDASLSYSLYFQPLYDNFSDSVSSHSIALKFNIYKELFLQFKTTYDFDTKPPIGVGKEDFVQNTSFIYNF